MHKAYARIVAKELKQMGFSTHVENDSVIVALRRWLGFSEVAHALELVFGEIEFNFKRIDSGKVRIS